MFGIGGSEVVMILIIALLVLGPSRIPEVARSLARLYKEFTKVRKQAGSAVDDIKKELKLDEALLDDEDDPAPKIRPPAGERAERPRISLDQLAVAEMEAQEALMKAAAPGPLKSNPYVSEPLPVPELDDYLNQPQAAGPADSTEPRR